MLHLHRLELCGAIAGGKTDNHGRFQEVGLHGAHRHSASACAIGERQAARTIPDPPNESWLSWYQRSKTKVTWKTGACVLSRIQLFLQPHELYPGFFVQGIFQAIILEWVTMPSSRGSSRPRNRTLIFCVSCIGRWVLYH